MPTGVEMLLKASGIDLPKLTKDFEQLKTGVLGTLKNIDDRLAGIEKRQNEIWMKLQGQETEQPQTPQQPQPQPKLLTMQPAQPQ